MKRLGVIWLLVVAVIVGGCGAAAIKPAASPTLQQAGDAPPFWVQQEAAWQALVSGDAHPLT